MVPSLSPNRGGKWGTHDLALLEAAVSSQVDWATARSGLVRTGNAISPPPPPPLPPLVLLSACWPVLVLVLVLVLLPGEAERTRRESPQGKRAASETEGVPFMYAGHGREKETGSTHVAGQTLQARGEFSRECL